MEELQWLKNEDRQKDTKSNENVPKWTLKRKNRIN